MRKTIGVLVVMMAMAAGGRLAGAQMVDPSTGIDGGCGDGPDGLFGDYEWAAGRMLGLEAALSANAQTTGDRMMQNMAAQRRLRRMPRECDECAATIRRWRGARFAGYAEAGDYAGRWDVQG